MRIHFTYKTVDKPWGGANNLIRALKGELESRGGFDFTDPAEAPTDVMFMNQLGRGPGGGSTKLSLGEVGRLRKLDGRKLVVRAVSLMTHAFRLGPMNAIFGQLRDRATLSLLRRADLVIFQSAYQMQVFERAGYRGELHAVIHNGADAAYWNDAPPTPLDGPLRIVSAAVSPREQKRHDLIAAISRVPGVEVTHFGGWPQALDPGNVRLMGVQGAGDMSKHFAAAHLFLHPAVRDACPNVLFEAICSGLPVLYTVKDSSSPEIVGKNGVPIDAADLTGTIEAARAALPELQARVRATRDYYRIDRAAAAYARCFEEIAGS